MTDERQPERVDLAGCARLLGLSRSVVWTAHKLRWFARPTARERGRPVWDRRAMLRWAAANGLSRRVPLQYWPESPRPAAYRGAEQLDDAGCVIQVWETQVGQVVLRWDLPGVWTRPLTFLADRDTTAIIGVLRDFWSDGPGLEGIIPGLPGSYYHPTWTDLTRVLGTTVPYWPSTLRIPELITGWHPGDKEVTALSRPDLDNDALLQLAATYRQDHAAARVLRNLAQIVQRDSMESALLDLEMAEDLAEPTVLVAAAAPVRIPYADRDDLQPWERRAGWLDVLSRTDTLARKCVQEVATWDGGRDLPFGQAQEVRPGKPHTDEWIARLRPARRTAAFALLGSDRDGEPFDDPETGAPVLRTSTSRGGAVFHTVPPQRLPATAALLELVLDEPIWVRTADGRLYLAPVGPYYGINWGYSGSGPGALALLIDRLLDDINAEAADSIRGAPESLENLTRFEFIAGTVLTVDQLTAARDGTWAPTPDTSEASADEDDT